jgi:hypothetical protein
VKPILVAGTGICYAAAVGYYAPLARAMGGSELHILEQWGSHPPGAPSGSWFVACTNSTPPRR